MSVVTNSTAVETVSMRKIWLTGLLAAAISAVVNAIIFFVAAATGLLDTNFVMQPLGQTLTVVPVIASSFIGVLVGTAVFAALAKFTSRPISIFRVVAIVVLVLSFIQPLLIPNVPLGMLLTLELMHVVAGVIAIYLLTTRTRA
jgi:hypothetical protein